MIIKGDVVFAKDRETLITVPSGYIGIDDGKIVFVDTMVPQAYKHEPITDYSGKLVMPGFCDMHTHAPQFENIGLGMNLTLLPWLDTLTFPTESQYGEMDYAEARYKRVVKSLITQGTTRAVLFATTYENTTQRLVELMQEAGLCGLVGKVNMDQNCPDYIVENTEESLAKTRAFVEKNKNNAKVKPILSPRFAPSCTQELLSGLGQLASEYHLPVQSHINENKDEIAWVAELFPKAKSYADVYLKNNLLNDRTLMAHCIHMKPEETEMFVARGVVAVHCPQSNANLASGMMPVKALMDAGMRVALGTDFSGGNAVSMAKTMVLALQMSKLRHQLHPEEGFLKLADVFYMATKAGGSFFGKVGSFEPGYTFDALVVDDAPLTVGKDLSLEERLGRFIYSGDERHIIKRYIDGQTVDVPDWE